MSKHINVTLTDREWREIVQAVDTYSIELEDQAEYKDAFAAAAQRRAKALNSGFIKLRDGNGAA